MSNPVRQVDVSPRCPQLTGWMVMYQNDALSTTQNSYLKYSSWIYNGRCGTTATDQAPAVATLGITQENDNELLL